MDRLSADVERMRAPKAAPVTVAAADAPKAERPLPVAAGSCASTPTPWMSSSTTPARSPSREPARKPIRAIKQALADLADSVGAARAAARGGGAGRQPDAVAPLHHGRETQRIRPARVRSLYAPAGAHAAHGGELERRAVDRAWPAQAHRRHRRRARAAGAHQPRSAAGADARARASFAERAALPPRTPDRARRGQESRARGDRGRRARRGVLERIAAPLEHMLRNALVHGVEAPEARMAAGKPESGRIAITLRQEANEIALVLSDDGAGFDLEALHKGPTWASPADSRTDRSRARAARLRGLRRPPRSRRWPDAASAWTSCEAKSPRSAGALTSPQRAAPAPPSRCTCRSRSPFRRRWVRSGGNVIALAASTVEQVLRLKQDALKALYDKNVLEFQDRSYSLYAMQQLLGGTASRRPAVQLGAAPEERRAAHRRARRRAPRQPGNRGDGPEARPRPAPARRAPTDASR